MAGFFILMILIVGINTFTSALLVYIASFKLSGKTISLKEGLKQCWLQGYSLLSWGVFYTCAGFILSLLAQTSKINNIIFISVKSGWNISVFLMMPIIMIEKLPPGLAFEKSSQYFPESAFLQINIFLLLALYILPLSIFIYLISYITPHFNNFCC
ncbi:hypothetical protein E3983_10430 [Legionella israelensis]|uniref:Uncharacterized protein n=1 Tax=Legionella israelensis TaxID=454 RepID=A0AAX1EI26_9GAMM|nr:hypothetical protein [Legionella israelensis]QBR84736.1 hypothetical protein E3983_10430 [Legionella israelensis]